MKAFITGGAGFIGSNLTDRLLSAGHSVVVFDRFSHSRTEFLEAAQRNSNFRLVVGSILDTEALNKAMTGSDIVFHLAGNADVRMGLKFPLRDVEMNTIGTSNVLEAMRANDVKRIAFSSTGSIYGEPSQFPTPESAAFPTQTSIYAASKLGAEGVISAYSETYGFQAFIFRYVSILGERYTHGHVYDFVKALQSDPTKLKILGDGKQKKSYLYVQDCIDAMLLAIEKSTDRLNIFNLGTDQFCDVLQSIRWITERMGVNPQIEKSGGERGWVGDSPLIYLDCKKIRALGWRPKLSIGESVQRTVDYLLDNPAVMK